MKKFTVSVMVTAVLGVAAYTIAGAQVPVREGGQALGRHGGLRGGPGLGGAPGFALRGLDLTDQQKEQIQAIRMEARESRQGLPADVSLRQQLHAELFADAPDGQKLASLQQQIVQAEAGRLAKRVEIEQKIAQVLSAEQRATVRERASRGPRGRGKAESRPF